MMVDMSSLCSPSPLSPDMLPAFHVAWQGTDGDG